MSFSRRQFLQLSTLALAGSALPGRLHAAESQQPLPIPPLLESTRGQPLFLTLQKTQWSFMGRKRSTVWGINGHYPGPTVRVKSGDNIKLVYGNRLSEPVAMSVCGLDVPGILAGGAGRLIAPGMEWSPVIPVGQNAATGWYHACTPGKMATQVYQGLAGMWLIEDPKNRQSALPNQYGVDDIPLILQDKHISREGDLEYKRPDHGGFLGDRLLVNGVENPYVEVSRGWIRLRLLNASNARHYKLRLSDSRPLHLIANDKGLLPAPIAVHQLGLAPGERREILIDMTQGEEVTLNAGESAGFFERLRSLVESTETLISANIVTLRPTGMMPLLTESLPARLLVQGAVKGIPVQTRELTLGDDKPGINGKVWNPNRVDIEARLGSWERWKVRADMPQAFYIQGVSFLIDRINGVAPLAEDQGWKDTVWVDGEVELLVYFPQLTQPNYLFQFYSQTLEMADRGSCGQLAVIS
ncbi:MAG: cell division protein FtsP [Enterobacteriaceae bacterium]